MSADQTDGSRTLGPGGIARTQAQDDDHCAVALDIMDRVLLGGERLLRLANGDWHCLDLDCDDQVEGNRREYGSETHYTLDPRPLSALVCNQLAARGDLVVVRPADMTYASSRPGEAAVTFFLAGALAEKIGALYATAPAAKDRLRAEIEAARKQAAASRDDKEAMDLCRFMVQGPKRFAAVYRPSPPGDGYMEMHEIVASKGGKLRLRRPRRPRSVDSWGMMLLRSMGTVGTVVHEDREVDLPTRRAYELVGAQTHPSFPHAPDNWAQDHAAWRRTRNAVNAREYEVRVTPILQDEDPLDDVYPGREAEISICEDLDQLAKAGDVHFEGSIYQGARIARWRPGGEVEFECPYGTALDPFTGQRFGSVDDLVAALRNDGRYVTDYRRVVGLVSTGEEVKAKLAEGWVLERRTDRRRWLLLQPRENGAHGDLYEVEGAAADEAVGSALRVGEAPCFSLGREVFGLPEACGMAKWEPPPPPRRGRQGRVVARHNDGEPILEAHLVKESYQKPLEGHVSPVVAPFGYPGGQEAWEVACLVEAVKLRRIAMKNGHPSSAASVTQ